MKKYDFYLAGAMCFIALVLYFITYFSSDIGQTLVVYKDNEVIAEYSLNDEGYHTIEYDDISLMTFEIVNNEADVLSASCNDKLCVHQKPIDTSGEVICCLPNKILLKIEGTKNDSNKEDYDAVAK